jgi:hypothetical protein
MSKECIQCCKEFIVDQYDQQFYGTLDLPYPQMCPSCRMQRRISFRNFFNLYHRKCDLSGKQMISMYHQDVSFPVYNMHEWWSDKWSGFDYSMEIDWNRSIFDQLKLLHGRVPRMGIMNTQCENTDYCNMSFASKNCYLVFGNVHNEDCCYGHIVWKSQNCFDCLYTYESEWCYECTDAVKCYNTAFSVDVESCSDCMFLVNCTSVRNSFGCVGLRNKEHCLFNEQLSKEEYESRISELNTGSFQTMEMAKQKVQQLIGSQSVKFYHGFNNENVSGDYLYHCNNVFDSYDVKRSENVRYSATLGDFVNCMDCNFSADRAEWCCNSVTVYGHQVICCHNCINGANLYYCSDCYNCKDCFACCGLKGQQYCIFNKQYSKEEYEDLLPRLIEKMKAEGTYGEFFPTDFSSFGYNETMASEYFPLSRDEVLSKGWKWKDKDVSAEYQGPRYELPDSVMEVESDIVDKVLVCEATGKPYKIIKQEYEFCRRMNLPLPRRCWEQRHEDRMKLRNPRRLFERKCGKCQVDLRSTYSAERPEQVLCEKCYQEEVL